MNLYIQMGHGMVKLCKDLCSAWHGTTVIVSPQNIYPTDELAPFAVSLQKLNGKVLFDPQLYSPRKYHKNLQTHNYWPRSGVTDIELGDCRELLRSLANINATISSDAFILPSNIVSCVDERWCKIQSSIANQARQVAGNQKLLLTIALGKDVIMDESKVENIIQYVSQWDIDGVYIVCEHPERYYLVDKPIWIANLLSLVAGIKRLRKCVVVGYANHQMLPLALAKCDAIAAGNFLNVRWFQPEHFVTMENDGPSRHSNWYYCPQTLSEYKTAYLDVAKTLGILSALAPLGQLENQYSRVLFTAEAMPSSTNYKQNDSFKHYLHCLRLQCELADRVTYKETRDALVAQLETAAQLIVLLHDKKIKGQDRDFGEIVDVNEAAIQIFDKEFGYVMSKEWLV